MIGGSLKQKNGQVLAPQTKAEKVQVEIDGEQYSLADVLSMMMQDPVETISVNRSADIAAGESYTVPQYVVGASNIAVYLDGLKASCGENGVFSEVGTKDSVSTTIKFNHAVAKDVEIIVRVGR